MSTPFHQWDVVRVRVNPEDKDAHPAVLISREEFWQNPQRRALNVLYGSTRRPAEGTGPLEIVLNGADGLERATVVSCGHLFTVQREKIVEIVGRVSPERRRQIGRRIVESFRLPL